jgi:hypothetical protein
MGKLVYREFCAACKREESGNGDNLKQEVCWIWYSWQISFAKSSWSDDEGTDGCGATRAVIAHDVIFPAFFWFDVSPIQPSPRIIWYRSKETKAVLRFQIFSGVLREP